MNTYILIYKKIITLHLCKKEKNKDPASNFILVY